jgi:hypothetical protein
LLTKNRLAFVLAVAAIVAGSCLLHHYACVDYAHACLKHAQAGCQATTASSERLRSLGSLLNFLSGMVAVCGAFVLFMTVFVMHTLSVSTEAILRKEFERIIRGELPRNVVKAASGKKLTEA